MLYNVHCTLYSVQCTLYMSYPHVITFRYIYVVICVFLWVSLYLHVYLCVNMRICLYMRYYVYCLWVCVFVCGNVSYDCLLIAVRLFGHISCWCYIISMCVFTSQSSKLLTSYANKRNKCLEVEYSNISFI